MRDILHFDPNDLPQHEAEDPIARARRIARRELPKRFHKEAGHEPFEGGFRVTLDGRPMRTPAKRMLVVPRQDIAARIAAEWDAQGAEIDPGSMPFTRLANSVVDGVAERAGEVAADAAKYAGTDLVCYRAEGPERLVERQAAAWDPLLDWVEERYGARFLVAEGVIHVAQDPEALLAIARAVASLDPWRLAGLHVMTTLTGSVLIALAELEGRVDRDRAWAIAHIDEDWNDELWGLDAEAAARRAARKREFDAASLFALG